MTRLTSVADSGATLLPAMRGLFLLLCASLAFGGSSSEYRPLIVPENATNVNTGQGYGLQVALYTVPLSMREELIEVLRAEYADGLVTVARYEDISVTVLDDYGQHDLAYTSVDLGLPLYDFRAFRSDGGFARYIIRQEAGHVVVTAVALDNELITSLEERIRIPESPYFENVPPGARYGNLSDTDVPLSHIGQAIEADESHVFCNGNDVFAVAVRGTSSETPYVQVQFPKVFDDTTLKIDPSTPDVTFSIPPDEPVVGFTVRDHRLYYTSDGLLWCPEEFRRTTLDDGTMLYNPSVSCSNDQ